MVNVYHNIMLLPAGKYLMWKGTAYEAEVEVSNKGIFLRNEKLSDEELHNISIFEEYNFIDYISN